MNFLRDVHENCHNATLLSYLHFWDIWVEAHQSIPATIRAEAYFEELKKKSLRQNKNMKENINSTEK